MFYVGPHISIAKGFYKAAQEAEEMGANVFQYFSRNPRGGAVKALDHNDLDKCAKLMKEKNFGPLLCHAPYTLNMASSREDARDFALRASREDLERLEEIPCNLYNFHPGSHTKAGVDQGIEWITGILNEVLFDGMTTTVLLETMAGKGTEIGRSFEELARIIDGTRLQDKLGVCLDTCHVFSAGYQLDDIDAMLGEFDRVIGLNRLKAIHLNDSLMPFGANKDRHACLGEGEIGIERISSVICHPKLKDLPFYCETPLDNAGHAEEIRMLQKIRAERGLDQ